MEIQMYQAGDEFAIVDLFETVFQRPWSLEQWKWRFGNNPAGNHKIALMWDNKVLAGHYAVTPVNMYLNESPLKTALSLTTMTHPDYGGRGVFKALSTYLYDHLENKEGFKFIWGFPNTNSHYGFIKYLGWRDINVIHTLAASPQRFTNLKDLQITKVPRFSDGMASLLLSRAKQSSIYVDRSSEYLNWRIVDKPSTNYDIWILGSDSHPDAVVVTKLYRLGNNEVDLNIVEWGCRDMSLFSQLITSIINRAQMNQSSIKRISLWHNLYNTSNYGLLEKMGFAPEAPITYLSGRPNTEQSSTIMSLKNWHISFIDSDVY